MNILATYINNHLYKYRVKATAKTLEHNEELYKRLKEAGILSNQKNIERFLSNNLIKGSSLENTLKTIGIA